ncbi:NINE protein [Streptomyces sp. NBC_01186]|uniref:NINE protein n=1 Tax=unclassified Streptomyces TaxID=2593676 RepID=UPI002DDA743B|nr:MULTISPECIES: NINE protein [unclassified Streptomyces]WSB77650.1 NINE protein [Streptomyces sp. NBC_01775]WSS14099.1 NINE protein [Streptomyces sp. NBC_01186]
MSDPNQPGYGYPQQPGQNPYGAPAGGPQGQPAYGYPQQPPMPGAPGPYGATDPNAPYGYDRYGRPFSHKSKIVAGVLQLFLGQLGIGRFYTGHIGMGIAQLLTCGGFWIWALVDGIIFLVSDERTDSDGRILRS